MAIRRVTAPTTPGTRVRVVSDFSEITDAKPERSLVVASTEQGRNTAALITCRHLAAGISGLYRMVRRRRDKHEWSPASGRHPLYDPTASPVGVALLTPDGEKRYILAPAWDLSWAKRCRPALRFADRNGNAAPSSGHSLVRACSNVELYAAGVARWLDSHRRGSGPGDGQKKVNYVRPQVAITEVRLVVARLRTLGEVGNAEITQHQPEQKPDARLARPPSPGARQCDEPLDHPHGWWRGRAPIRAALVRSPPGASLASASNPKAQQAEATGLLRCGKRSPHSSGAWRRDSVVINPFCLCLIRMGVHSKKDHSSADHLSAANGRDRRTAPAINP